MNMLQQFVCIIINRPWHSVSTITHISMYIHIGLCIIISVGNVIIISLNNVNIRAHSSINIAFA
jgi:hypothetical protein